MLAAEIRGVGCVVIGDPHGPGRARQVEEAADRIPAALGPTGELGELAGSWALARAALRALEAGAIDAAGPLRAEERLPELLLHENPALVERLAARRLAPFEPLTPKARRRMEETALAYVQRQGNAAAMAAALDIHPQTARYRIARLRELLGTDLDDPDARFELELALRARARRGLSQLARSRPARRTPGAPGERGPHRGHARMRARRYAMAMDEEVTDERISLGPQTAAARRRARPAPEEPAEPRDEPLGPLTPVARELAEIEESDAAPAVLATSPVEAEPEPAATEEPVTEVEPAPRPTPRFRPTLPPPPPPPAPRPRKPRPQPAGPPPGAAVAALTTLGSALAMLLFLVSSVGSEHASPISAGSSPRGQAVADRGRPRRAYLSARYGRASPAHRLSSRPGRRTATGRAPVAAPPTPRANSG